MVLLVVAAYMVPDQSFSAQTQFVVGSSQNDLVSENDPELQTQCAAPSWYYRP